MDIAFPLELETLQRLGTGRLHEATEKSLPHCRVVDVSKAATMSMLSSPCSRPSIPTDGARHVQTRGDILKLSCCIPTFNRSRSLARAIRSLCDQTLEPGSCEVLIVDNGSSDNTRGETESIMRGMPDYRLRYLFEPEPGLLSGRHRGALE